MNYRERRNKLTEGFNQPQSMNYRYRRANVLVEAQKELINNTNLLINDYYNFFSGANADNEQLLNELRIRSNQLISQNKHLRQQFSDNKEAASLFDEVESKIASLETEASNEAKNAKRKALAAEAKARAEAQKAASKVGNSPWNKGYTFDADEDESEMSFVKKVSNIPETPKNVKQYTALKNGDIVGALIPDAKSKNETSVEAYFKNLQDQNSVIKRETASTVYGNTYRTALNEERAKLGIPSLPKEMLEMYNQFITENSPSVNDNGYISTQKENNIKSMNMFISAVLSGNFLEVSKKGSERTFNESAKQLKVVHDIVNGRADGNGSDKKYTLLSEVEKETWNYYIGIKEDKKAFEYIRSLDAVLTERLAYQNSLEYDAQGTVGNLKETGAILYGALEQGFLNLARSVPGAADSLGMTNMDDEMFYGVFAPTYSEQLKNYVLADSQGADGKFFNGFLQVLNSTVEQTPNYLLNAAGVGPLGYIMSSVGSTTTEAVRNNTNSLDDLVYGVVQGAMEFAVDKFLGGVSSQLAGGGTNGVMKKLLNIVDDVVKNDGVKKLFSKGLIWLGTGASESLEELIQGLAEPAIRSVIYGEKMNYSWNTVKNALESAVIGFFSGILMGGFTVNSQYNQHKIEAFGENIIESGGVDSLLKFAEGFGVTDSNAYNAVKDAVINKNTPDAADVASLYSQTMNRFNKFSDEDVAKFIKHTVENDGIQKIADTMLGGDIEAAQKFVDKYSKMSIDEIVSKGNDEAKVEIPNVILGTANNYAEVEAAKTSGGINNIDAEGNNGYNGNVEKANVGGFGNDSIERGNKGSFGEGVGSDTRAEGSIQRKFEESAEAFSARSEKNKTQTGQRGRVLLRFGNSLMAYTPIEANDSTNGGRAVNLLRGIGIGAEFAEGDIETNSNGVTIAHNQALTTDDGKVYVSDNATLSDIEIAAHESVHVNDVLGTEAFLNYEAVICEQMNYDSEKYFELANLINKSYYNGKYDIESIDFYVKFRREIAAYINQFVVTDLDFATQQFSDLFYDWDAVVEASRQFNKDIGADYHESASLMPENLDLQATAEEVEEITEPDISKDKKSETERIMEMVRGSHDKKAGARRFVQDLGKALGVKVVFEDTTSKRGYFSDGYIDERKVIHIDYANKNPIAFLFKHEMVHYGSGSEFYKQFVRLVYNSKQFEQWLREKTKMPEGSSVERMAAKYMTMTAKAREGIESLSEPELQEEMVADFAGSDIFTNGGSGLKAISTDVSIKQRNAVSQWIADFISWIKKKINKVQGSETLTFELSRIEDSFNRMISDARQNPTESKLKHSIDPNFARKYAEWDKKTVGSNFRLGETSNVLKKLGVDVKSIYWDKSKILKIKKEHPAMTDEVIIQVPNILEYPILVMKSKTVNGRLTLFGEVYDANNNPVLAILELNPTDKNGHDLNMIKVASAYGKDTNPQRLIDTSEILYVDENKKRTNKWLTANGLQLPRPSSIVGSINSITHNKSTVNTNSMQEKEINSQDKIRRSVPVDDIDFLDASENTEELDYVARHQELFEEFQNGELTAEEYKEMVDTLFKSAGEEKGTISKGETVTGKENFDNPVPLSVNEDGYIERYVRTVLEGGHLNDEMLHNIKQQILSGKFAYKPTSNEANMDYAKKAIEGNAAESIWEKALNGNGLPNKNEIAIGEALLKNAIEQGDTVKVVKYTAELADVGTRLGQSVQALSLLKRMSGAGQLVYVKRVVDTLNNDLQKRFKNKAPIVEIDENMAIRLAQSKTQEDIELTYGAIMNDIAAQVPATFLDKWNAWRYMAMLCNPTTHIRNLTGNGIFVPAITIKNVIATAAESVFVKEENRTKSIIVKKEFLQYAEKDFESISELITSDGKMNPKRTIADNKPIFKTKALEAIRKFNFDLLEKEDIIFLKHHYKNALAGFLQARKVNLKNVSEEVLLQAREYAIQEAKKATYRDANGIANAIQQFSNKNKVSNVLTEGILPFKKTPINIVRRGIEYSPIGILKTLSKAAVQLKNGEFSASQFIDGLAAGITGTGIMALGMLFSSLGVAVGGFDDDDEDRFRKLNGEQEYSLRFGDYSYTIDWAAPACIPFFIGVAVNEMSQAESNENIIANIGALTTAGLEPIINLSMLSGIQETVSAARYADADDIVYKVAGNIVGSYFTQSLPTVFGKTANVIDDKRRSNYIDKTSNVPVFIQSAFNTLKSKTPVLSTTRQEYIDAWGETKETGGFIRRFFQNFLSPGYISEVKEGEVESEIKRLLAVTGESSVVPDNAPKYFRFKNTTKNLTAEEYQEYATTRGSKSADYIREAIMSEEYKRLTDAQKAEALSNIYKYCNAYAKSSVPFTYDELNLMYDGKLTKEKYNKLSTEGKCALAQEYFLDNYLKAFTSEKNGGSVAEYFIRKAKSSK